MLLSLRWKPWDVWSTLSFPQWHLNMYTTLLKSWVGVASFTICSTYTDHWGNDYVGQISQHFHVRQEQHIKKKLKRFIFNEDVKPKDVQSSITEHLLNNPSCAENYLDSKFKILFRARNLYHFLVLESVFIRTRRPKICKQSNSYNL